MSNFLVLTACSITSVTDRTGMLVAMPESFIHEAKGGGHGKASWLESFSDVQLVEDIATLASKNLTLQSARARLEKVYANYGLQQKNMLPTANVTSHFEQKHEKSEGTSSEVGHMIGLGASLQWEFDIWGKLQAQRQAAALSLEEQKMLVEQTSLELQTLLVEKWIAYHAAVKQEYALRQQQSINAQFLELIAYKFKQGERSALDVLEHKQHGLGLEASLSSIYRERVDAIYGYDILLGKMPKRQKLRLHKWPEIMPLASIPSPKDLIKIRPDLKAIFYALLAADQEVAASVANRLPQISIGMGYTAQGSAISQIGTGQIMHLTTGILAPIFDAGKRKIEVLRKKAEVKEVFAMLEKNLLEAVQEIENGLFREQTFIQEKRLLMNEITIAGHIAEKNKLRYLYGQESYLTVLKSQKNLQLLHQRQIAIQRSLLINRARLLKALGATWNIKKRDVNEVSKT